MKKVPSLNCICQFCSDLLFVVPLMLDAALSDRIFLHLTTRWWNTVVTHITDENLPVWRISAQASWSCKSHSRHCTDVCQKEYQPLSHSAEPLWVLWKKPLLRNCTAQQSVKKGVKIGETQYIAIYSNVVIHHSQRVKIKMSLLHLCHLWGLIALVAETSSW